MWHISKFQPTEIIELAIKIEEKGAELYKNLAEKTSDEKTKKLLLYLSSEEEKHQADFKRIGKDLDLVNPSETYSGEFEDYIKSTVETHMFSDADWLKNALANISSKKDIIRLAASFEKDSILFFLSLKKLLPEAKQGIIQELVNEEESHLIKLAEMK